MNKCQEYLKAFRKTVKAKPTEKIDKRYKPYLAPNDKHYQAHCGYCAEVNYLEDIYNKGPGSPESFEAIKLYDKEDYKEMTYAEKVQRFGRIYKCKNCLKDFASHTQEDFCPVCLSIHPDLKKTEPNKEDYSTPNDEEQANLRPQYRTEYRWENVWIGQGHYYQDLTDCIDDARKFSEASQKAPIVVEQFKPQRRFVLAFLNGKFYTMLHFAGTDPIQRIGRYLKDNDSITPDELQKALDEVNTQAIAQSIRLK